MLSTVSLLEINIISGRLRWCNVERSYNDDDIARDCDLPQELTAIMMRDCVQ